MSGPRLRVFRGLDHLAASIGSSVGRSPWRRLDAEAVASFVRATGGRSRIPDEVPDLLLLSLASKFAADVYRVDGVSHRLNYGLDGARLHRRVPVATPLRGEVELLSLRSAGERRRLVSRVSISSEEGLVAVTYPVTLFVP